MPTLRLPATLPLERHVSSQRCFDVGSRVLISWSSRTLMKAEERLVLAMFLGMKHWADVCEILCVTILVDRLQNGRYRDLPRRACFDAARSQPRTYTTRRLRIWHTARKCANGPPGVLAGPNVQKDPARQTRLPDWDL